jgi:hypothetical protein
MPDSNLISLQTVRDRALIDLAAAFANRVVKEPDGTFWLETMPTANQRNAIVERRDMINRILRPASMSDADKRRIEVAVGLALSGWLNAKTANPAASIAAYVLHLQDLPVFAVEKACANIAKGLVEGLSPDYPPSAARIHRMAAEELEALNTEAISIGHVLGARKIEVHAHDVDERLRAVTRAWLDRADPKAQAMINPPEETPLDKATRARAAELAARTEAVLGRTPAPRRDLTPTPQLLQLLRQQGAIPAEAAE